MMGSMRTPWHVCQRNLRVWSLVACTGRTVLCRRWPRRLWTVQHASALTAPARSGTPQSPHAAPPPLQPPSLACKPAIKSLFQPSTTIGRDGALLTMLIPVQCK